MTFPVGGPVSAVLFDFHSTLVDQGAAESWLASAWALAGRHEHPLQEWGADATADVLRLLDHVWDAAREIDPASRRDLDPAVHREVFHAVMELAPNVDGALAASLYDTMVDGWAAYDDAAPVLRALKDHGIASVVLSNIGCDIRPVLDRTCLSDLLTGVVLSYEVGAVKPDPAIFAEALHTVGVPPDCALMVGDDSHADGGAATLGIRTLILPRTRGPVHGLDAVLRLAGVASLAAEDRQLSAL